jgi:hypothetical protein
MCVQPLLWLLYGFDIRNWNPLFISCYEMIEEFITIFLVSLWNNNAEDSLWDFLLPCKQFRYPSFS